MSIIQHPYPFLCKLRYALPSKGSLKKRCETFGGVWKKISEGLTGINTLDIPTTQEKGWVEMGKGRGEERKPESLGTRRKTTSQSKCPWYTGTYKSSLDLFLKSSKTQY